MRISDWSSDVCSSDLPGSAASSQLIEKGEPAEIDAEGRHRIEADPEHRPVAPFQQARQVDRRQRGAQKRGAGRSEERRVGKECISKGRSRWSAYHEHKNDMISNTSTRNSKTKE